MFKLSPNTKGMISGLNGTKPKWKRYYGASGIYPHDLSPNGKDMVLRKILFRSGNGQGKR